jgi:hypothetical protein
MPQLHAKRDWSIEDRAGQATSTSLRYDPIVRSEVLGDWRTFNTLGGFVDEMVDDFRADLDELCETAAP